MTKRIKTVQERLERIFGDTGNAIAVADEQVHFLYMNCVCLKMFGYIDDANCDGLSDRARYEKLLPLYKEHIGDPVTFLMPEEYRAQHLAAVSKRVTELNTLPQETKGSMIINKIVPAHGLKKDGTVFPLNIAVCLWPEHFVRLQVAEHKGYLWISEFTLREESVPPPFVEEK